MRVPGPHRPAPPRGGGTLSALRIGVVIPAHDEAATIGAVVAGLWAFPEVAALVVVDDASDDATSGIAADAGAEVLRLGPGEGGGKGRALRAGLAQLMDRDLTHIVFLDGDGQHDPADLQGFLDHLSVDPRCDVLLGSRYRDRARIPKARWNVNALGSWTLGRIAGVRWEDTQCGFRMVRREVLARMALGAEGFAIEMEMVMKAAHHRIRWAHIPVKAIYHNQWRSHFRGALDTWRIAWYSLFC